jgi:hypothetical protein
MGKSVATPCRIHLPQQAIQKTDLSIQAPNSSNNGTLKIVTVVKHITTELSKALPEKDKLMVITKMVLKLMKQNS